MEGKGGGGKGWGGKGGGGGGAGKVLGDRGPCGLWGVAVKVVSGCRHKFRKSQTHSGLHGKCRFSGLGFRV
jgi:hypothetical protein